jgi:plasmid maintenance system antidote protein VapI
MHLDEWLRINGKSRTGFARDLGVPVSTINRILKEKRIGTDGVMRKIVKATSGAVTPNDFMDFASVFASDSDASA